MSRSFAAAVGLSLLLGCGAPATDPSTWGPLANIQPLGRAGPQSDVYDVAVYGDYAYGADWQGLTIFSLGSGADAKAIKHFPSTHEVPVHNVAVAGHFLLFDNQYTGLKVLDLTSPAEPVLVTTVPGLGTLNRILVDKTTAYCVSKQGLHLVDVADPPNAKQLGEFLSDTPFTDVAVADGYAFVTGAGLTVLSVSDPANIKKVGELMDFTYRDIVYRNKFVYALTIQLDEVGRIDLRIIDVSSPAAPTAAGSIRGGQALGWFGELLAVATPWTGSSAVLPGGARFYDLSDPKTPKDKGEWPLTVLYQKDVPNMQVGTFHRLATTSKFALLAGSGSLAVYGKK